MRVAILELLVGGLLLVLALGLKLYDFANVIANLLPRRYCNRIALSRRLNVMARVGISLFGIACVIDPLISGTATLVLQAPHDFPTTLDNLRARIVPIGLLGPAGGDYIVAVRFDSRGTAVVPVRFHMFEVGAQIDVFDVSRPEPVVTTAMVYVSPFVRRQLWTRSVELSR